MRATYTFVLFLLTITSYAQLQETLCKSIDHQKALYDFELKSKSNQINNNYNVSFYRLDLNVNPEVKFISGSVCTYFTVLTENFDTIKFDFADSMIVDSILFQNKRINSISTKNNILSIGLNDTIAQNQLDSIQVFYHGIPESGGLGTFVQNSYNGIDSIMWTLSQPYGASSWWPCKNSLDDKADSLELNFITPIKNQVASIGLLQSIDTIGSNASYHWKSNYPITTYLIAFSVTNYDIIQNKIALGTDSLLLQHFLYPNDSFSVSQSNIVTEPFIRFFDSLFGPYPFIKEKYGHASFSRGGGMEHQTMSFMGSYGGELIAHELAHQWFGNYITCGSWQDLWLNEAFAVYANTLTYEFDILHDSYYLPIAYQGYRNISFLYPHASVFISDTSSSDSIFTRIPYFKGASLLHMLRWKVGDDAFFNGVRSYLQDSTLAYSFARTYDFKRHLEQSSGKNLDEFFKDWYYGKGYPTYSALWSQEGDKLKVTLNQTQSDPTVFFFNMPIPYQVLGNNLDTTIILDPKFSGETFTININKKIDSLVFDPLKWIGAKSTILTGLESNSISKNIIDLYPNPSTEMVSLKFNSDLYIEQLKLYSIQGELIKTFPISNQLDISEIAFGSYILRIQLNDEIINKELIIGQ